MTRRRRSQQTVSLFAFQDVIMSVSGIILVTMLLLTLELVERPPAEPDSNARQVAEQLRQSIETATAERTALAAGVERGNTLLQDLSTWSPAELQRDIDRQTQAGLALNEQQQKLETNLEKTAQTERRLQAELFDLQEVIAETRAAQEQAAELRRSIHEQQHDTRPVYSLPRGFDKQGWLIVVSRRRIEAAPLGIEQPPTLFTQQDALGRDVASQLHDWIRTTGRSGDYFLLMLRPSGIADFDELRERFDNARISYGFDLVDEDFPLLHPQRGAAI